MQVQTNRTFLSFLLVSMTMFGLSFLWHNFILNDLYVEFQSARFTPLVYFGIMAGFYGLVSLIMTSGLYTKLNNSRYDVPVISGPIVGMVSGVLVFLVMMVTGTFYHESMGIKALALGLIWQVAEQGIGGLVWGFIASTEIESQNNLV